jgi:putative tryptophan/tyrosine transport system substrate-binding protein
VYKRFLLITALILFEAFPAEAQQSNKVPRIGFLFATNPSATIGRIQAFRQGLHERGYVEGKTILIEYRYGEGKLDRMPALASELVGLKVDLIVTGGPADTRAAKQTTTIIPIVMAQDTDPVGSGFVASLARPGGNITGLSTLSPEISGKQLELLKEIDLRLSRVAVVTNSTEPGNATTLKEMQLAAGAVGVQLQYLDLRGPEDIESALSDIKSGRASALIVLRNPVTGTHRKRIIEFAAKNRLPAMYVSSDWVEAGGLMSYALDIRDNYRRSAIYVDKILKGTRPADLPVEQPTKFELIINLKAAKQIGLTIPPNVLTRADRVIR